VNADETSESPKDEKAVAFSGKAQTVSLQGNHASFSGRERLRFQPAPRDDILSRISVIQYALIFSSCSIKDFGAGSIRGGIVERLLKLLPWLATRSRKPSWTPILLSVRGGQE